MNNTPNEILYEMISKFKQLDRVDINGKRR